MSALGGEAAMARPPLGYHSGHRLDRNPAVQRSPAVPWRIVAAASLDSASSKSSDMCLVPRHSGRNDMGKLLVLAGVVAFSLPAIAQDTLTRVTPDAVMWKENPAFPKGVLIATLVGDPTKA